ncbi:AraC family transcriptional regulator [Shimia thalassica]|uniref:AraC family transcriptional regulator n=1 Tax=Shimia thalassica TaxID=1715693 RepID=UPI0026E29090|nr:AraC family transcriptional regulator [Shimia thalassica]MDO6485718.1 AraC family transcriptional regulator [Shimia thalassica]
MNQDQITQLIQSRMHEDGLLETGVEGVQLFRATQAMPCVPAVYEPSVIAITSGCKEAVLDGARYAYDSSQYMLCPMSMPVQAGTPNASPENPLYGVYISLNPRVMRALAREMENASGSASLPDASFHSQAIKLSRWDADFSDALYRLLQLGGKEPDTTVLGDTRLRELYFAILQGEAGPFARHAFGAGHSIARSIAHVSSNLHTPVSIDELAAHAGMSRAVFHRKFKQATSLSPIQFVKSMRLNNAATKIAEGMSVNQAALDVGYVSASQFSREFKRFYGQSPRRWSDAQKASFRAAR